MTGVYNGVIITHINHSLYWPKSLRADWSVLSMCDVIKRYQHAVIMGQCEYDDISAFCHACVGCILILSPSHHIWCIGSLSQ